MIAILYPDSWVIIELSSLYQGDGLYVINYGNIFMVKQVQLLPNGILKIISANKDYESYEINPTE